tara:strand:+ start:366 stop:524 length:159 start_codon:yes stop_codon:yes gene_type:complete
MDLAAKPGRLTQQTFLKAKLLIEDPKRILNLGTDVSFGSLEKSMQLLFWCIG